VTTDPPPAQELADSQRRLEAKLEQAKATIDDLTQRLDQSLEDRERLLRSVADSPAAAARFEAAAAGVPEDNDDDHA
jgi:chromosome segregation ATPase